MKLWIVLKEPVDLDGAPEIVGAFTTRAKADEARTGAGTYTVAEVEADRAYRAGELLDVERIMHLARRQF